MEMKDHSKEVTLIQVLTKIIDTIGKYFSLHTKVKLDFDTNCWIFIL